MPTAGGLYYTSHGGTAVDRYPTVLIHGAGGTLLHWPPQARRLRPHWIIAADLPGHGRSLGTGHDRVENYAAVVLTFLDAMGIEQAVLVGHSMGSAIALTLAILHPDRVVALALAGAGVRLRVSPDVLSWLGRPEDFARAVSQITEWSYASGTSTRLKELAASRLAATDPAVLLGDFTACDRFDLTEEIGGLRRPTLILAGAEDRMTPLKYAAFLRDRIDVARLEIIPAAGHMMMLERPRAFSRLLRSYLDQVAVRRGSAPAG